VELEKGNACLQDPDKMVELEEQDSKDPGFNGGTGERDW
jgi:hypothetical protein